VTMTPQTRVLVRMRDVVLALNAASRFDQMLSRIRLQKFVYLLDVMIYLVELLPPSERHVTYRHGPFDAAIQNAVDCLAFRGLVRIADLRRETDGTTQAKYALTDSGKAWLGKLLSDSQFQVRSQVAASIAEEVDSIGWERIVALVYAEPTFVTARSLGYGAKLSPHNPLSNSAALVLRTMKRGLRSGFERTTPEPQLLLRLFFLYLRDFSLLKDQKLSLTRSGAGGGL
jgi:hypothetical protein